MTVRWTVVLLMTAVSMPVRGQSEQQDRFALTAQQVAQTISNKGMQIGDQQVSLLANVVATEPYPVLDILSIEPPSDRLSGERSATHSYVKLACHLPGTCLPFYAVVSWPEEAVGRATNTSSASPAVKRAMLKPNVAITMRAGTHAILVMDDNRSHIQIVVVTLENGVAGHSIRVASPDHKQVYLAEVVSAHLLRRSF